MGTAEIFGTKGAQLRNKRILICVTGSIAAIEVPHLVREILRYEGDPIVILSEEAKRFVAIDALTWCMDKEPITKISGVSEHVKWAINPNKKVDLCLICPATANTISKLANGVADGPVTLAALALVGAKIPIIIVPAAHSVLLDNPITEKNIKYLKQNNVHFLETIEVEDKYKFPPLSRLMENIFDLIQKPQIFQDMSFLITGGATREYLDDVRFISNPSTGISAFCIAKALQNLGARVKLILGEGNRIIQDEGLISTVIVKSTQDMYEETYRELHNNNYDGFISVAAVSDYKPVYKPGKIPSNQVNLEVSLVPTIKIIKKIREEFPNLFIVAYKAEVGLTKEELIKRGKNILLENKLQLVCANWVGESEKGFASETNEIFVIRPNSEEIYIKDTKSAIGERIADIIAEELNLEGKK
jgi:phosphopantothenoylcysteine decarboxylase/phosphopantothenate--cysteine ligase